MIIDFCSKCNEWRSKAFVEKNNSVLTINFKGNIIDSYEKKSIFDFGQNKDVLLLDVVNAINNAKKMKNQRN